jgi:hypothetical protein
MFSKLKRLEKFVSLHNKVVHDAVKYADVNKCVKGHIFNFSNTLNRK